MKQMNESSRGAAFEGRGVEQGPPLPQEGRNAIALTAKVGASAALRDGCDDTDVYSQFLLLKLSPGGQ